MWTKKGSRFVHSVVPNEYEWLTMLTCINVVGQNIPIFYIFKVRELDATISYIMKQPRPCNQDVGKEILAMWVSMGL